MCASCFGRYLLCVPPVFVGASCVCLLFCQVPPVCASCFARCLLCVLPALYRRLRDLSALSRHLQALSAVYRRLQALSALHRCLQALSALYRLPVLPGASCVCLLFCQVPPVCASYFCRGASGIDIDSVMDFEQRADWLRRAKHLCVSLHDDPLMVAICQHRAFRPFLKGKGLLHMDNQGLRVLLGCACAANLLVKLDIVPKEWEDDNWTQIVASQRKLLGWYRCLNRRLASEYDGVWIEPYPISAGALGTASMPPVSIAVSCLSCLRPPPPPCCAPVVCST